MPVQLSPSERDFLQKHFWFEMKMRAQQIRQHEFRMNGCGDPLEKEQICQELEEMRWQHAVLKKLSEVCDCFDVDKVPEPCIVTDTTRTFKFDADRPDLLYFVEMARFSDVNNWIRIYDDLSPVDGVVSVTITEPALYRSGVKY